MNWMKLRCFFLACVGVVAVHILSRGLFAAPINWNGSVSTDWALSDNWDGPLAPADDAVTDVARFNLASYTNQPNAAVARSVAGIEIGGSSAPLTISLATSSTIGGDGIVMESGAGATLITTGGNNTLFFGGTDLTVLNSSANALSFTARLNGGSFIVGGTGTNGTTGQVIINNNSRSFTGLVVNSGTLRANRNGTDTLVGSTGQILLGDITPGNSNDATILANWTAVASAQPRPMTVRAGSSGTLTYRSIVNGYNLGTILLNNDLVVDTDATRTFTLGGAISGAGDLIRTGAAGTVILAAENTYSGDTHVDTGALTLADTGSLMFYLQDLGVSNQIVGAGTGGILNVLGTFRLDATSLPTTPEYAGVWNLVDVSNMTATFDETDFGLEFVGGDSFNSLGGGLYSLPTDAGGQWLFSTSTGNLSLFAPAPAVPEPASWLLLLGMIPLLRRSAKAACQK